MNKLFNDILFKIKQNKASRIDNYLKNLNNKQKMRIEGYTFKE